MRATTTTLLLSNPFRRHEVAAAAGGCEACSSAHRTFSATKTAAIATTSTTPALFRSTPPRHSLKHNHSSTMPEGTPPPLPLSRPARERPLSHRRSNRPPDLREQYVLRPFIRDKYVDDLQHVENRGMYAEELDIARSRCPNTSKTLTIGTDGALSEREFEFTTPPLVPLFYDRAYAHRARVTQLAKIGKGHLTTSAAMSGAAASQSSKKPPTPPDTESEFPMVNAIAFPYCVPRKMHLRNPVPNPLNTRERKRLIVPEDEEDGGGGGGLTQGEGGQEESS